jgi:hypothetical protein
VFFSNPDPRPSRPSLRVLRWLLCQLLPVWLCLGFGWAASAAAAVEEGAPMCDQHGASVAATAEVPEVDRGKLEELPCDALLLWIGSGIDLSLFDAAVAHDGLPPPAPELQFAHSRPDGLISLAVALPARAPTRLLPRADFTGLPPRAGHRLAVFRPPALKR